jgi:hypothetical protein
MLRSLLNDTITPTAPHEAYSHHRKAFENPGKVAEVRIRRAARNDNPPLGGASLKE